MEIVLPTVKETAFNCPYCHAYAAQIWYHLSTIQRFKMCPNIMGDEDVQDELKHVDHDSDRDEIVALYERFQRGRPFFDRFASGQQNIDARNIENLWLCECQRCFDLSVWIFNKLVFPTPKLSIPVNSDLPNDIRKDYEEAQQIFQSSPRSAAALLRLAVQKLCKYLGCKGNNINDDIGVLVKRGLDPVIQQALDSVRVIGNNAVHPGEIDLNDNPDMVESLFRLVNLIADQMITRPKAVEEMYAKLPSKALNAIRNRDKTTE